MMELLNEKVINSKSFELLQLILKNRYIKNTNFSISYNEFEEIMIAFIEKIMGSYLEDTKFYKDKYSCVIKDLPSYRRGEFNSENNVITINKKVINDIYLGKINYMITIFHELNHFKVLYDIKLGRINRDLIRSLKEDLLRVSICDPFSEQKTIKAGPTFINDNYYECNYTVFSDEKVAEINAINDLISFIKMAGIELSLQHLQELNDRIKKNTNQYNNYLRDLRLNLNFNNYFLDFEEAFNVMIKFNPDWLAIPQLNIEYYLGEDGKITKRTKEELEERLKTETDEDIKEYIQYLLTPNTDKRLSRSEFPSDNKKIKDDELNYIPINNYRKSGFKR